MRFLYFIPGVAAAPRERLAAELGYVFGSGEPFSCASSGGPEGQSGCVVGLDIKGAQPVGYYPEAQTWRRIPPNGPVWVGFYNEQRPGPENLSRGQMIDGHAVKLGDGNDWTVPLVRGFAESEGQVLSYIRLPQGSELNEHGKWVRGDVLPPYRNILRFAQAWMDAILGQLSEADDGESKDILRVKFDFEGLHTAAVAALQVNYRVGAVEAAALSLLTNEICVEVMNAACDLQTFAMFGKKKGP